MIWQQSLFFIVAAIIFGSVTDHILRRKLQGYPRFPVALLLSIAACSLLVNAFDDPIRIIKGILFAEIMIVIAIQDGLTHEIFNWLLLPVFVAGAIEFQLIPAVCGFFAASLPFLCVAKLTKGGIGGGDIKLMAATGFVLGPSAAIGGALAGLFAFLPYSLICRRYHKSGPYALAPWLCSGCFLAYLLGGI